MIMPDAAHISLTRGNHVPRGPPARQRLQSVLDGASLDEHAHS